MVQDAQLYYPIGNGLQLPATLTGWWFAATDRWDMGFHTAIYLLIIPGFMRLWSEDIHPSLTKLMADALYTFSGKMVDPTDGVGALSASSFITGQPYISCTDGGGFSLAFTDHC